MDPIGQSVEGHAPKVGRNELHCSSVCEWDRNFQRCYGYVLFNNLVLAVPKMGHMSKNGTFPTCKVVYFFNFFVILVFAKKILVLYKCSQNWTDILK